MRDQIISSVVYVKVLYKPTKFLLSVNPSKKMRDRKSQRKNLSPRRELIEPTTTWFNYPLLYRLSYEEKWEQVVGDYVGNCSNVNVKGTNECCAASNKDTNDGSEI